MAAAGCPTGLIRPIEAGRSRAIRRVRQRRTTGRIRNDSQTEGDYGAQGGGRAQAGGAGVCRTATGSSSRSLPDAKPPRSGWGGLGG